MSFTNSVPGRSTQTGLPDSDKRMICYFCDRKISTGRSVFCLKIIPIWICTACNSIILKLTIDEYGNVKVRTKYE